MGKIASIIAFSLALAACGGDSPTTSTQPCQNIQWTVMSYAGPCCTSDNPFGPHYGAVVLVQPGDTTMGQQFPYTVPPGQHLGISTIEVSSKLFYFGSGARGSYFHLALAPLTPERADEMRATFLVSVPTTAPHIRFQPPIHIAGGQTVWADFINNAPFAQYMSATLTGYLAGDANFSGCNFQAASASNRY